jgi:SAM-dependent methyltransferase
MADAVEVTAIEIARLAGVGRAAVSNWRKRHDDFPAPVGGTTASPTFRLSDVEAWLRQQGKAAHLPADEAAWQQIRAISPEHELAQALVLVGELLVSLDSYASSGPRRRGADALRAESDPDRIVTGMREALRARTVSDAYGPGSIDGRHVILLRALADLVAERGPAAVFDLLLGRMHEVTRLPQVPYDVARLMVALLNVEPRHVYDPACGTGRLLTAAAARWPGALIYGDDANQALLNLAMLRAAAHGTEKSMFRRCGLRDAPKKPIEADAVVCVPPYGERDWAGDETTYDPRWTYGIPPKMEPELAWVQHSLANLRPGGQAVLLLPPAVATRASGRRIRAELLRRSALRAVIALPAGAAAPYGIGLHLWVLRSPDPSVAADARVLIAEVTHAVNGRPTVGDAADWPARTEEMIAVLATLDNGTDAPDAPGITARIFRVMDLLDDDTDISPARRLHDEPEPVNAAQVLQLRERLTAQLRQLADVLPDVDATPSPAALPIITIGDLARTGAVTITTRGTTSEEAGSTEPNTEVSPLWRARDLVTGNGPSARVPSARLPSDTSRVRAGDVVVPMIGDRLIVRVVTNAEAGAVLGPHIYLLRPDPARLDPWFLAGFLRRDDNARRTGSLGSTKRHDIRRAHVPRIPVDDQTRYGTVFRRLAEFDTLLRAAAQASGDMMKAVANGLAAGAIRPTETEKGT